MKKSLALLAFIGLAGTQAQAGELSLVCAVTDLEASPFVTYEIKLTSPEGEPALGGVDTATLSATESTHRMSEEVPTTAAISGCEDVYASYEDDEIYFECDADGDAGFGVINVLPAGLGKGTINFPNGNKSPRGNKLPEDKDIEVVCKFL